MKDCQNCGAKIDETAVYCPLCGEETIFEGNELEKDKKIEELEQKIEYLEEMIQNHNQKSNTPVNENRFQAWIIVVPIAFMVLFFVVFFLLVAFG